MSSGLSVRRVRRLKALMSEERRIKLRYVEKQEKGKDEAREEISG